MDDTQGLNDEKSRIFLNEHKITKVNYLNFQENNLINITFTEFINRTNSFH